MSLKNMIINEYETLRQRGNENIEKYLETENFLAVRSYFLYFAKADVWEKHLDEFIDIIIKLYEDNGPMRVEYLKLLVFLAVDLKSYALEWYLSKELDSQQLEKGFKKVHGLVLELEKTNSEDARLAHDYLCKTASGRLTAEAVAEADKPAELLNACGDSLEAFIDLSIKNIQSSNIYQMAMKTKDHDTRMILGNDYGEYLNDTLWLGMSYTTTNPPLVNMAWDIDRTAWTKKLEKAIDQELDTNNKGEDVLLNACSLGALIVVEKNCKLLRSIFLSTAGNEGYACYQVNPENHDNSEAMIKEVRYVYGLLEKRLEGVPNVSFKLPGTSASLKAAEVLSSHGISLTITLEFCVFQALEFAKIFQKGKAITSNVVVMNGRLAFPVRDELIESGIEGAEEASKWAGVEVTRKLYKKLYSPVSEGGMGIDSKKVRIMNASLRIYGTDIPDISELTGPQVMTIFPNVRRTWDSVKRDYIGGTINNETPVEFLEILKKSEIFCQAWWTESDGDDGKPLEVLTMKDEDKKRLQSWGPIKATLGQFLSSYDELRTQVKDILKK